MTDDRGQESSPAGTDEKPEKLATKEDQSPQRSAFTSSLAIVYSILVFLVPAYFFSDWARERIIEYWAPILAASVFLATMPFVPVVGNWFKFAPATRRAGIIIFVITPVIVALLASVVFLSPIYQAPLIRVVFLLVVSLLPGSLYYLFIASRRDSLLNEFITSLDRLGLLPHLVSGHPKRRTASLSKDVEAASERSDLPETLEDRQSRNRRIHTYLERFEAIYGRLPDDLVWRIVRETDPLRAEESASEQTQNQKFELANIFSIETTVPVIGATVLVALGWIITLPPLLGAIEETLSPAVQASATAHSNVIELPGDWLLHYAALETTEGEQSVETDVSGPPADTQTPAVAPEAVTQTQQQAVVAWLNALQPEHSTAVHFAFLGAYFFSLQALFRRYVRRDLGPNAYLAMSMRIILAVIGVWVAMEALKDLVPDFDTRSSAALVVAFAIGAFPQIVWKLISSVVKRFPGMANALPSLKTDLPLNRLAGFTIWHETRLEEEDVENVPNMATADLVGLILHTRFPPDRIIDWVDEAILYMHLGAAELKDPNGLFRKGLRPRGIRTASSLVSGYLAAVKRGKEDEFLKIGQGEPNRLLVLLDTVGNNPNLAMIQHWRGLATWP